MTGLQYGMCLMTEQLTTYGYMAWLKLAGLQHGMVLMIEQPATYGWASELHVSHDRATSYLWLRSSMACVS